MISRKIVARNVSNLTDARYFAAWGVEWISFDEKFTLINNQINPEVVEMINWLEGCKYALDLKNMDLSEELLVEAKEYFQGIICEDNAVNIDGFESVHIIHQSPDAMSSHQLYLDMEFDVDLLKELVEKENSLGFVFSGSDEEKVGYKSFDQLDEFFELLEIE